MHGGKVLLARGAVITRGCPGGTPFRHVHVLRPLRKAERHLSLGPYRHNLLLGVPAIADPWYSPKGVCRCSHPLHPDGFRDARDRRGGQFKRAQRHG